MHLVNALSGNALSGNAFSKWTSSREFTWAVLKYNLYWHYRDGELEENVSFPSSLILLITLMHASNNRTLNCSSCFCFQQKEKSKEQCNWNILQNFRWVRSSVLLKMNIIQVSIYWDPTMWRVFGLKVNMVWRFMLRVNLARWWCQIWGLFGQTPAQILLWRYSWYVINNYISRLCVKQIILPNMSGHCPIS